VSRTCVALAEKEQLRYERLLEAYGNTTVNTSDGDTKALTVLSADGGSTMGTRDEARARCRCRAGRAVRWVMGRWPAVSLLASIGVGRKLRFARDAVLAWLVGREAVAEAR
jgi:hypothetical protein